MPFPADFVDAHFRDWGDAELLFTNGRWANADQMYGFSAECGMKAVMVALGMPISPSGTPDRQYRKHIQDLWALFCTFVSGRNGSRYLGLLPSAPPFVNWSHHNRYAADSHFSENSTQPNRVGAECVVRMVRAAKQDNLL